LLTAGLDDRHFHNVYIVRPFLEKSKPRRTSDMRRGHDS
jgi:hypothetical protein